MTEGVDMCSDCRGNVEDVDEDGDSCPECGQPWDECVCEDDE